VRTFSRCKELTGHYPRVTDGKGWADLGDGELSVSPGRVALPILEASGSVWMLDNMDK
jgi:hypothetical protein